MSVVIPVLSEDPIDIIVNESAIGIPLNNILVTDAVLRVIVPSGSTITCSRNGTSLLCIGHSISDNNASVYYFIIHEYQLSSAPWEVTAVNGVGYTSIEIVIDTPAEYSVELHPYIPDEYQLVEYIEKQDYSYIDTGLSLDNNNFDLNIKMQTPDITTGSIERPVVSTWKSPANYFNLFISGGQFDLYMTGHVIFPVSIGGKTNYDIEIIRNGSTWSYVFLGQSVTAKTGYTPGANYATIKLFVRGDENGQNVGAGTRISYFDATVSGTLQRKMYSCYRKSDDVIGMYDVVYGVFYPSAGSASFLKGNDLP